MSKTASLQFNGKTGKWEASHGGHVFLKSASKEYVVDKIVNRISAKAVALGISAVEEIGASATAFPKAKPTDAALVFDINERFDILEDFVDMVATRTIKSAIITGEGGVGKTHTVIKALESAGLTNIDKLEIGAREDDEVAAKGYALVKGFATAKGLFRILFENKNSVVVFDDCDSVLRDPTAANMLKAALDSYEERIITWGSEAPFGGEDDLPRSFEFTGGAIFISNMPMYKVPQALISRSMPADVSMTRDEIITRMTAIVKSGEFLHDYDMTIKMEALAFIAENANRPEVKSINLRTLINTCHARVAKPDHWKRLALYAMLNT